MASARLAMLSSAAETDCKPWNKSFVLSDTQHMLCCNGSPFSMCLPFRLLSLTANTHNMACSVLWWQFRHWPERSSVSPRPKSDVLSRFQASHPHLWTSDSFRLNDMALVVFVNTSPQKTAWTRRGRHEFQAKLRLHVSLFPFFHTNILFWNIFWCCR